MLQELVKNKARGIYSQAGKNVVDAAIAECSRMGLSHTSAKELLSFAVSDDPKVPLVAEQHLMAQIVNGVELAVSNSVVVNSDDVDASFQDLKSKGGCEDFNKAILKDMPIAYLRETAIELGVDILDQDDNKLTREQITQGILAKQAQK
ncbi:hypothetical protein NVP1254O_44 [Vibrio phage 1.254.O._10N.286.45.C8]|nr:hypothetical protein NVP1254O_44 [Vibrio phage 1.254.O._10N.286.45.C8]